MTWLYVSGCSFDWIIAGDVRGMAVAFRKSERNLRQFQAVLKGFDGTEQGLLLDALRASQDEGVPMEEAIEGWTNAVKAHRAEIGPQQQSAVSERGNRWWNATSS